MKSCGLADGLVEADGHSTEDVLAGENGLDLSTNLGKCVKVSCLFSCLQMLGFLFLLQELAAGRPSTSEGCSGWFFKLHFLPRLTESPRGYFTKHRKNLGHAAI